MFKKFGQRLTKLDSFSVQDCGLTGDAVSFSDFYVSEQSRFSRVLLNWVPVLAQDVVI